MRVVAPGLTFVACGGTIESRLNPDGTKRIVGGLARLVPGARVVRFRRAASFTLQLTDLVELAAVVRAQARNAPVIVTTGTDTLEDVAFVLDCLAPPDGVVVTGASGAEDAPANLAAAAAAAQDPARPRHAAVVAFAGVYRAGRAVTESAPPPDLFAGSPGRPVGSWDATAVHWNRTLDPLGLPDPPTPLPSVGLVVAHPAVLAPVAAIQQTDLLVVAGFGAGNVPPQYAEWLERRLGTGRPVVLTSCTAALPVAPVSWDLGSGARLLERGAWSAGRLPARKAALLAALTGTGQQGRRRFADAVATLDAELRP